MCAAPQRNGCRSSANWDVSRGSYRQPPVLYNARSSRRGESARRSHAPPAGSCLSSGRYDIWPWRLSSRPSAVHPSACHLLDPHRQKRHSRDNSAPALLQPTRRRPKPPPTESQPVLFPAHTAPASRGPASPQRISVRQSARHGLHQGLQGNAADTRLQSPAPCLCLLCSFTSLALVPVVSTASADYCSPCFMS